MRTKKVLSPLLTVFLLSVSFQASSAEKLHLRVCNLDIGFPPFTNQELTGEWQKKIQHAANQSSVSLDFHFRPRTRCKIEIDSGRADAIFTTPWEDPEHKLSFPMSGDSLDPKRAVGKPIFRIYVESGSQLKWDGEKFSDSGKRPFGVQHGLYVSEKLKKMGLQITDPPTPSQAFKMLKFHRLAGVIINEEQGKEIFAQFPSEDFQMLQLPFSTEVVYLAVSNRIYHSHTKEIEAFWVALGKSN